MHVGYQKQLKEAIAIVYNHRLNKKVFETFRIKDSHLETINDCKQ